jgi:glycosyltransferase involved in cell wall biosynthesis
MRLVENTSERSRVTVVIPTLNRSHWLGGSIESVLAQTHRDFTLVIADNASTDETQSVVAGFEDERLHYVRRPRTLELNEHYNLCVDEISSEYFLIVPDDDALVPEAIETLLPVLERNPKAGIAHGRARIEQDGLVVVAEHDMTGLTRDAVESGDEFIRRAIAASHRIHATTALYRTEALRQLPLDPRDYPATEFGLWLRLALDWELAFVASAIATVRVHAGSYTSTNARVTSGGYVQDLETIRNIHDVKLRFLREHAGRLDDPAALHRSAGRAFASQLVNYAGHATLPERRLGNTIDTLARCGRIERKVLIEPGTWRLLGASVLGRRLVDVIKRRRARNARAAEAVAP